jgi:hypothetical protein
MGIMTKRPVLAPAVMVLALLLGACQLGTGVSGSGPARSSAPSTGPPTTQSPKGVTEKDFDRGAFPAAPRVDNHWYPLTPGTQYVFEGRSNRGKGVLPHRVVSTVTDLTKVIDGVRAVVVWDQDINAGQLEESELAFQAQDKGGNVWLLGEYPEVYEGGRFKGAPDSWIAGLQGATPGVLMRARPRAGTFSYLQGLAPKIEFQDRAKVSATGLRNCVPVNCYGDVVLIDEWNPLETPDVHQLKYYAPGVGNIRVGAKGDPEAEELVLVKVGRLGPAAEAKARKRALQLENHAYTMGNDPYRRTRPIDQATQVGRSS